MGCGASTASQGEDHLMLSAILPNQFSGLPFTASSVTANAPSICGEVHSAAALAADRSELRFGAAVTARIALPTLSFTGRSA